MKKTPNQINLKYLAELLGLSQATVSLALSPSAETSGVAAKTRERVQQAARALNYSPNFSASSLASGRSYTIGVVMPAISEGYYSTIIAGIEEYLLHRNYFFLVASHHWEPELMKAVPEAMKRRGVEGLIVVNTALPDLSLPSVRIGDTAQHHRSACIRLDEEKGTRLALEYLVSQGHREIAFFRGDTASTTTQERWNGILRAASEMGIRVDRKRTVQLKIDRSKGNVQLGWLGYSAAQELLERKVPFTALMAYNDSTAIGAMRAFLDAGLNVPRDVSVVGYDDIPAAEYERPALTTVRQPLMEMGAAAAKTLLQLVQNEKIETDILIDPTFVVRASAQPRSV